MRDMRFIVGVMLLAVVPWIASAEGQQGQVDECVVPNDAPVPEVNSDGYWTVGLGKPHRDFLERHKDVIAPIRPQRYPSKALSVDDLKDGPVVYGYLPYWEMDYEGFQWDVLTHVAYFCADMEPDGSISNSRDWLKPSVQALIAEAHQHNVQVVLSVVNFENDEIAQICNNPEARKLAIDSLLTLVQEAGADGVNIDFEFVPTSAKASFVQFMSELTKAFHEAIPGSHVSYAGPCVDWNGAYDYDQLALASDDVFIMGYCYHPHHDVPGPKAPIEGGDVWWSKHLTSTIEEYVTWGGEGIEDTMILGLPFYGYAWEVAGPEIPSTYTKEGELNVVSSMDTYSLDGPWQIEPVSMSSYQQFQDENGNWIQRWLDNAESHSYKFELACDKALKGVGFWALGYDGGDGPVWDALRETLEDCEAWGTNELSEETDEDAGALDNDMDAISSADVDVMADEWDAEAGEDAKDHEADVLLIVDTERREPHADTLFEEIDAESLSSEVNEEGNEPEATEDNRTSVEPTPRPRAGTDAPREGTARSTRVVLRSDAQGSDGCSAAVTSRIPHMMLVLFTLLTMRQTKIRQKLP